MEHMRNWRASNATSRTTTITTGAAPINEVVVVGQSMTPIPDRERLESGELGHSQTISASSQTASTAAAPKPVINLGGELAAHSAAEERGAARRLRQHQRQDNRKTNKQRSKKEYKAILHFASYIFP